MLDVPFTRRCTACREQCFGCNASDANGRFALLTTYWDLQEGNKDTTDFADVTNDR
jgi:hypothetical protein